MPTGSAPAELRADLWLWTARFFKTRSLARQAIEAGRVELNELCCKPAKAVRTGDHLRIGRAEERMELVVLALSARRGPASEAQQLYRETDASVAAREALREQRRLSGAAFDHPPGRPDKQARRQLRKIKDLR
ncbi:MAG: S4 domain-containing protein [Rhodanobacter sp.]